MYKHILQIWSRMGDLVRCMLSVNIELRSSISKVSNMLGRYNMAFLFLLKA